MAVNVVQVLVLCLVSLSWAQTLYGIAPLELQLHSLRTDFHTNLRTGVRSTLPPGIIWHSPLTSGRERCACNRQGVLKLTFSPTRRRAEINMTFEVSQGWTFNVGDSVTNNGWAGDANTQDNDAEVHSNGNTFFVYGRDNRGVGSYGLLYKRSNFIRPNATLTLNIADELVTAYNGAEFLYINSYKLFQLNGQKDLSRGGVNYDVYLAMNRVVGSAYRHGCGLCQVRVKFYPK